MKKTPIFLLLPALLAGCANHDNDVRKGNPYVEWERKKDADDEHRFFYDSWLHPDDDAPAPRTMPTLNSPER